MNKALCVSALVLLVTGLLVLAAPAQAEVMACFVDTPSFDTKTNNFCFAVGSDRNTTACFEPRDVADPANSSISWSEAGCSGFTYCIVPISWFQSKTVSATITDALGNKTTISATARYEPPF